ncbi:MAG: C-GCAxxG-C-C family protein, partial [Candidatus Hinthialibacter sp.]
PYSSFPYEMMKYGAGGIGEYGSVCGALNGAAAAIGLFVNNKSHRNSLIENVFSWSEKTALPIYQPEESSLSITPSVSKSVLCHASTANWIKISGHKIDGKERSERCKRLSADVAQKTTSLLNYYFDNCYKSSHAMDQDTETCMQCHSQTGKLANIKGKMECSSCHEESLAHKIFADVHYKFME